MINNDNDFNKLKINKILTFVENALYSFYRTKFSSLLKKLITEYLLIYL